MPEILRTALEMLAYLGLSIAFLATIAGFLGSFWWFFDLFSHFRLQYLLGLLLMAGLFLALNHLSMAWLAFLLAGVNLSQILPFYFGKSQRRSTAGPTYRCMSVNLLQMNHAHARAAQAISARAPDFVLLIEINQRWDEALQPALADYPYAIRQLQENNYGIALYSRHPLANARIHYFCESIRPSILTDIHLEGQTLHLVGTHPPPPLNKRGHLYRNSHIQALAGYVAQQTGPVLVMGDLNHSAFSSFFRQFLRRAGLFESRYGFGIQATWPVNLPLLLVPIDQILVTRQIFIQRRLTGPSTGSDHLPVAADFWITGGH